MTKNNQTSGARRDAYRITQVDPFHSIVPYVMPKRTESEVFIHENVDITELLAFIKKENDENGTNIKLFHIICTAVAKTLYLRPLLNSFVAGRRFWQRNDITLSFVAKKKFEDYSEEGLMTLKVDEEMNLNDISKIILGDVEKVRSAGGNDLDKTMNFVGKLPRPILAVLFFVLKRLEFHGRMPKSLTKGDPNYTSVLLSNLGSIKCGAPYHHLSNYGTNSIMMTIGVMHKELIIDDNGNQNVLDTLDIGVTLDERIADGFYFAKSVKLLKYLIGNPSLLYKSIKEPIDYEF